MEPEKMKKKLPTLSEESEFTDVFYVAGRVYRTESTVCQMSGAAVPTLPRRTRKLYQEFDAQCTMCAAILCPGHMDHAPVLCTTAVDVAAISWRLDSGQQIGRSRYIRTNHASVISPAVHTCAYAHTLIM